MMVDFIAQSDKPGQVRKTWTEEQSLIYLGNYLETDDGVNLETDDGDPIELSESALGYTSPIVGVAGPTSTAEAADA